MRLSGKDRLSIIVQSVANVRLARQVTALTAEQEWMVMKMPMRLPCEPRDSVSYLKGYYDAKLDYEVRHGRWINHGSFEVCSVCGEEQYGHDSGRYYCQNCGARMDGEQDESR